MQAERFAKIRALYEDVIDCPPEQRAALLSRQNIPADIAAYLASWLTDPAEYAARVERLTRLRERIAGGGASARGAATIVDVLERRPAKPLARPHYLPAVPEAGKMAA